MVYLVQDQVVKEKRYTKQTKNCVFMTGSQHFSQDDIQFQLVYGRGQGVNVPSPVTLNLRKNEKICPVVFW